MGEPLVAQEWFGAGARGVIGSHLTFYSSLLKFKGPNKGTCVPLLLYRF